MKGSVPVHAFDRPVLLIGRENMNRAVQGDVVAVEIFDEKDWKAPGDAVVDQESALLVRRPVARPPPPQDLRLSLVRSMCSAFSWCCAELLPPQQCAV